MTRHFFTDPLAAAWMSKHFGMRLEGNVSEHNESVEFGRFTCAARPYETLWGHVVKAAEDESRKWYIHPDSLHLLEPRAGDLVTCIGVTGWMIDRIEARLYYTHNAAGQECSGKIDDARILQRNGTPFMWPEVGP
jgi:hypothetical protein